MKKKQDTSPIRVVVNREEPEDDDPVMPYVGVDPLIEYIRELTDLNTTDGKVNRWTHEAFRLLRKEAEQIIVDTFKKNQHLQFPSNPWPTEGSEDALALFLAELQQDKSDHEKTK